LPASIITERTAFNSSKGPNNFDAHVACHAVPQNPDIVSADLQADASEERNFGRPTINNFIEDLAGIGPFQLKAEIRSSALWIESTRIVEFEGDVIATGLGVVTDPIENLHSTHEYIAVGRQAKCDAVTYNMSPRSACNELFGAVRREIAEILNADPPEQARSVGAFDVQLRHVMALIPQYRCFAPSALLVAPVGELERNETRE
jgi:hypothetical protein